MLSGITKYIRIMAVSFIVLLTAICFYQNNKIKKQDKEIGRIENNYKYYLSLAGGYEQENRVLKLSINEINTTNDSLLQTVKEVLKKLKVKDQNLKQITVINTVMKDTASIEIKTRDINFSQELKLNSLTTITVNRKDSILTAILDMKNSQILFVEEKKEYRNKYKNGWQRFWHFDYKKDINRKYQIHNSNDLIKVTETRVVEVTE